MIKVGSLTVGTDAELPVFLVNGDPIPVTGLVGGTKADPRPLGKLGAGYFIQEDNAMLEFNIPAATTPEDFERKIQKALKQIKIELPPTMECRLESAVEYHAKFLKIPELSRFGCDPDYCVYTEEENPKPKCDNPALRTASAHIHVGWENPTPEERKEMVKMMDVTVGLSFIHLANPKRKLLYGKAGSYRPKAYGIEYRQTGNEWLYKYAQTVFCMVQRAAELVNAGHKLDPEMEKIVIESLNTGKIHKKAQTLANELGVWPIQ